MWVDHDKWIHWGDQCKYCKNIKNCEYHGCMNEYIHRLKQVKVNPPVYGSLSFVCDYFCCFRVLQECHGVHCCCSVRFTAGWLSGRLMLQFRCGFGLVWHAVFLLLECNSL